MSKHNRVNRDFVGVGVALLSGARSHCVNYQIGACAYSQDGRMIGTGYNGPVRGDVHCDEHGCAKIDGVGAERRKRECRGAHAESNLFGNLSHQQELVGATLYVSLCPCLDCAKAIAQRKISRVVYVQAYHRIPSPQNPNIEEVDEVADFFSRNHVELVQYSINKTALIAELRSCFGWQFSDAAHGCILMSFDGARIVPSDISQKERARRRK